METHKGNARHKRSIVLMVILIIFTMMSTSSCFLLTYSAELWVDNWTTYDLSI